MIAKEIQYVGKPCLAACDARCDKAWGINNRPRIQFDENDLDDFGLFADSTLGTAPIDPGTYEGGHAKPRTPEDRLNKWCVRECERSCVVDIDGPDALYPDLPDFSMITYNQPWKHKAA